MNLEEKYENLKKIISSYESCAVAFSGGVDSSFLSKVCYDVLGEKAIAITVVSPMLPESELKDAMDVSSFVGIKHYFIKDDEIEDKVAENPVDRCYHCKKTEFGNVKEFAELKGVTTIFDGTNLDDLQLPKGYTWVAKDVVLNKLEKWNYPTVDSESKPDRGWIIHLDIQDHDNDFYLLKIGKTRFTVTQDKDLAKRYKQHQFVQKALEHLKNVKNIRAVAVES